jgi:hypothetical protein
MGCSFLGCLSCLLLLLQGQQNAEDGTLGRGLALDDAAVVADDLGDEGEAEARTPGLGRHERIEEVRLELVGDAGPRILHLDHQRQADARAGARHGKAHARTERGAQHDAAGLPPLRDRLGGILEEVEERLHQLVAVAGDRGQGGVVVDDDRRGVGKAGLAQTLHVVEHEMDVDGLRAERALVTEHLHAVDQVADAIRLDADELRQRPVVVLQAGLEQLGGAADARERVLDLVREHGGHAGHGAGGRAMRQLALDHVRHGALLQHQDDQAGMVGEGAAEHVDQPVRARARQADVDPVLVDGRARAPHLPHQRAERTGEGDDVGQRLALEHALAEGEEGLRRRVGVEHPVVVAEHQDRMRKRGQQQVVFDVPA